MIELGHRGFLEVMEEAQERGVLFFQIAGKKYAARIDEIYVTSDGKAIIVSPDMYVKNEGGEWHELEDNHPRYVAFNWLAATYVLEADHRVLIRTEEGPIYILLDAEEDEAISAA